MQQEDINEFKGQLRGDLIEPADEQYEEERKVYNGMIDRKPRLIAKCADVADVMTAIHFGRKQDLLVSIRGGGHNAGGLGICDDGLVIDLSPSSMFVSIQQHGPYVWAAVAPGAMSITQCMHLGWRYPLGLSPQPGLEA